jgi:hypothetical protein
MTDANDYVRGAGAYERARTVGLDPDIPLSIHTLHIFLTDCEIRDTITRVDVGMKWQDTLL